MDGSSLRELGKDLLAEKEYERALAMLAEAVRRNPADHRSRMAAARCLLALHERERAVLAWYACAEGLLRRDYLLSAIAACKLALEVSPTERLVLDTLKRVHARAVREALGRTRVPPQQPPEPLIEGEVSEDLMSLAGEQLMDRAIEVLAAPDNGGEADPTARPPLPLFAELSVDAFMALVSAMDYRELPEGAAMAVEGRGGEAMVMIVAGAAEVTRQIDGVPETLGFLRGASIFGEVSLLTGAPPTASVTVVSPTEFFEIRRAHLNQVARAHPTATKVLADFVQGRMTRNLLRTAPMFQKVPEAERPHLLQRFRFRAIAPGERVLTEGEHSAGLFLVLAGELVVQKDDPAGGKVSLGVLREGDVAGEISLLTGLRVTADVIATRKTAAMMLERDSFNTLTREFPSVRTFLEGLSDRRLAQIKEALRPVEILDADVLVEEGA